MLPTSLQFAGASTDSVAHGADTVLANPSVATVCFWAYPTDVANVFGHTLGKFNGTNGWLIYRPGADGTRIRWDHTGSTYQTMYSATGFWAANTWIFGCYTWTKNSTASNALYKGTLTSPAASFSLATNAAGSGLTSDVNNQFKLGSQAGATNSSPFRMAMVAFYPGEILTLGQIQEQQRTLHRPVTLGCKLFCRYGVRGIGWQEDISGFGNHGIVTGATIAPGVPIPQRRDGRRRVRAASDTGLAQPYQQTSQPAIETFVAIPY